MPRNVRNFWLDTRIDGRTPIGGGPRSATGGFTQTIYIRGEGGTVETAVTITGEAFSDGEIRLFVEPGNGRSWEGGLSDKLKIEPYTANHKRGYRITSKR